MSELGNSYSNIASKQNEVTKKLVKFGKDFFPFIILILNIAVTICSRLFNTRLENPFTADFFIQLGTNILTTMFCYATFISYAENNEKAISKTYSANLERWGDLSGRVRNGQSDMFIQYCREQVIREREEKRQAIILNHTMIPIEQYEKEYKGLSSKAICGLVASGKLSKTDGKYIKKANSTNRVKPINPLLILCGVHESNLNDVGRDGISHSTIAMISRPIGMFILTAVVTMFKGSWLGISDASAIFDMIYSVLMIVLSSVFGYTSGATTAREENDKIRGRIFFLERFINSQVNKEQSN